MMNLMNIFRHYLKRKHYTRIQELLLKGLHPYYIQNQQKVNADMKRRNYIAKELLTPKFKPKIVKPKKGKGSFKRQKINTSLTNKTT